MGLPARKINFQGDKRIEEVSLSMDGKRLIFLFENGEGYSIPRQDLPSDDGTPVTSIQIYNHRGAVSISQASGEIYDLPWDSIKHYAQGGHQKKILLGRRLKKLREMRELSQEALARAAGISRMQLARLEKDISSPHLDTLVSLLRVLGVSPKEMIS